MDSRWIRGPSAPQPPPVCSYPDATPEELQSTDNVCIICREEMVTGAKRLPCNHIFHTRSGATPPHQPPTPPPPLFGVAFGVVDDDGGDEGFPVCVPPPPAACARGSSGSRRAPRAAWTSCGPLCPRSRPPKPQSRTRRRLRAPRGLSPKTVSGPRPKTTHVGFRGGVGGRGGCPQNSGVCTPL